MRRRVLRADVAITCAFLVVAVMALIQARGWPFRAGLFPLLTSLVLLVASILKLATDLLTDPSPPPVAQHRAPQAPEGEEPEAELIDVFATASRAEWLSALGWMGAFFVTLWLLGALISVPLFAVVYLSIVSRESVVLAGSYALASWLFVYGLFDRLLHIPLPQGALLAALGWS